MVNHIFPFQLIQQSSNIILYGAGKVGRNFYKQVSTIGYANIIAWVDKNYEQYGKEVQEIAYINQCEYDYIVIAINNSSIATEVFEMLISDYGVEKDKIIYSDLYEYSDEFYSNNVYEQKRENKDSVFQIEAKKLLTKDRLDLAVRYLVAKDIVNGIKNEANISLYSRMILVRNTAYEGQDYFSEYSRDGIEEYIESLEKIYESMKTNGFDENKFIPVGNNDVILNGAHRTAVALALEEKIWIKYFPNNSGITTFGIRWFEDNGFNTNDKIRILRAYADLYNNCGIVLLFGTCEEQWDYLQAQIAKQVTIVGTVEIDFSDNYIAYENLFHEIYSDPLWRNVYIDRKLDLLMMAVLKIKVLLVSDENFKEKNLYHTLSKVKQQLRRQMYFDTDIAPVVMHASDSYEEFVHLKQILLSVNNLKHLQMRVTRNYSQTFVKNIEKLKKHLKKEGILCTDGVCAGSAGWEIYGLRKSQDLDFICQSSYRKKYGDLTVYNWVDNIDYVRKNSIKIADDYIYTDDVLISDDNLYYIFYGMKFINIDIIARKKSYDKREKDVKDIRLYRLFKDYIRSFENKEYLKRQIEREFYKKR